MSAVSGSSTGGTSRSWPPILSWKTSESPEPSSTMRCLARRRAPVIRTPSSRLTNSSVEGCSTSEGVEDLGPLYRRADDELAQVLLYGLDLWQLGHERIYTRSAIPSFSAYAGLRATNAAWPSDSGIVAVRSQSSVTRKPARSSSAESSDGSYNRTRCTSSSRL